MSEKIVTTSEFPIFDRINFPIALVEKGEVKYSNPQWKEVVSEEKEKEIIEYRVSSNVEIGNKSFISFKVFISPDESIIWLYPSDFLENLQSEINELKKELELKDKRFKLITQNSPIAFLIIDYKTGDILFFNNNLIVDMTEVDLHFFYSHMNLYQLLQDSDDLKKEILNLKEDEPTTIIVKVTLHNDNSRWWSLNASRVEFDGKDTVLIAITDITEQKEQEQKLQEAYAQIQQQNEELRQAQEELRIANEQLAEAHKSLEDSMKYAKKVQQSILFPIHKVKEVFANYDIGVLFRPHSHVSGDFIWVDEKYDYIYVGVCDATGHGAGGAIMAILGNFALSEAFKKINSPQQLGYMLSYTHKLIVEQLGVQNVKVNADGFEAQVMAFPKKYNKDEPITIYASAAKQPLVIIENGKFDMYKPETHPIGFVWDYNYKWKYPVQKLEMTNDTVIYLLTDGFISQHGLIKVDGTEQELKFGKRRLEQTLLKIYEKPTEEQIRILDKLLDHWKQDLPQTDDITVVIIKRK